MKKALITGCNGLIGSQAVEFFINKGFYVIGIDNNMRQYFFGNDASTKETGQYLLNKYSNFSLKNIDIRDYESLEKIFKENLFDLIIHTAAQPSHDWAAKEPLTDFTINANGTLNLLELTKNYCKESVFIFTSTNKVYGDRPNFLNLKETDTRFEYIYTKNNSNCSYLGINENMSIDNCLHSVFGASKVAADIMCQEYGKYFNMNVGIFRGGCLTGPNHAGTEMHGFLSYLVKCIIHDKPYTIYGYKGKQVRDNIHSYDLINMFWEFYKNPKKGEVYNAGGGRGNEISILEAINLINKISGRKWEKYTISNNNRIGDHIWYVSDCTKFKNDYVNWKIEYPLEKVIQEIIKSEELKTTQIQNELNS